MIPVFNDLGELPEGIHWADWDEISTKFGYNLKRIKMLNGLMLVLNYLKVAGCKYAYLDGSFVTIKEFPNDYDVCWDIVGVDISILNNLVPELINFDRDRRNQKMLFLGEFLPYNPRLKSYSILEFFQFNRNDIKKGIIGIEVDKINDN